MAERITVKDLEGILEIFCNNTGQRVAENHQDVGAFKLDGANDGYRVEQITSERGGIRTPFGSAYLPARELYRRLEFAVEVAWSLPADWLEARARELREAEERSSELRAELEKLRKIA